MSQYKSFDNSKNQFFSKLEKSQLFTDQLSFIKDHSFQQSFALPELVNQKSNEAEPLVPQSLSSNFQISNILKPNQIQFSNNEQNFSFAKEPSLWFNNSIVEIPVHKKISKNKPLEKLQQQQKAVAKKVSEEIKELPSWEQSISKQSKQIQQFYVGENLINLLSKFFYLEKISAMDTLLTNREYNLLKAIIYRKLNITLPEKLNSFNLSKDLQKLQVDGLYKSVRPEQNYKFVVKKIFKMIKENFKQQIFEGTKTYVEMKAEFLEHFFKEVAEANKMPLEAFTPPTNSKCNTFFWSINRLYISFVEQSSSFMKEFIYVLRNSFMQETQKEMKQKLKQVVIQWYQELDSNKTDEEKLCEFIRTNSWCKLPWSVQEINRAIKHTQNLFQYKLIEKEI